MISIHMEKMFHNIENGKIPKKFVGNDKEYFRRNIHTGESTEHNIETGIH